MRNQFVIFTQFVQRPHFHLDTVSPGEMITFKPTILKSYDLGSLQLNLYLP